MSGKNKSGLLNRLVSKLNQFSVYPMVLNDWKKYRSPLLIEQMMNLGYFKSTLKPTEPELSQFQKVCVLAPHQDDEAIGCAGLLHLLPSTTEIHIVFLTDGFQKRLAEHFDNIIELREKEANEAASLCGATSHFLRIPNDEISLNELNIKAVHTVIDEIRPDLILMPWLFDRPEKHRQCNLLAYHALMRMKGMDAVPVWGYQVHNILFPNIVVDISDKVTNKTEMIRCHKSQITEVAGYDSYIIGMNQWNAQYHPNKACSYAETYFGLPLKQWLKLCQDVVIPNQKRYLNFE